MLLTKTIKMSPRGSTLKRYQSLGYQCQYGDIIDVKVTDLPRYSPVMVEVSCDYCGSIQKMHYEDYMRSMEKIIPKYACPNCSSIERKESNQIRYGVDSVTQLPEIKEKIIATNMERYGVFTTLLNKETQEKIKQTNIRKYGTEYACGSEEVSNKRKRTTMERYGAETPLGVPEFQEKSRQTIKERYGVENVSQSDEIKIKKINTVRNKYGVDYVIQAASVKKKAKETMKERYGVENASQNAEIRAKQVFSLYENGSVNTSKQQKYLHDLFDGELNYPIFIYNADILVDNMIDIEYDGGGHSLQVDCGKLTEKEFKHKEIIRNNYIKRAGYKMVRIISKKDYLPSDEVLLKMLSDARQYFNEYPNHSWIEYHIDDQVIRNAEHKDGITYDYGPLRKLPRNKKN